MEIYDVFISYRRSDGTDLAYHIAEYLRKAGLKVFFDTKEIKSGEDFTLRIEGALRQAPNYLLVATPDVFRFRENGTDWVLKEMTIAAENYAHDLDRSRMYTFVEPAWVYRDLSEGDPSQRKVREKTILPPPEEWPGEIFDLSKSNRITLRADLPDVREFREILTSVTRVTRHNMWNAGHRWLKENRMPGRRFATLDIAERIFPRAVRIEEPGVEDDEDDFPSFVQKQETPTSEPKGEKLPLFDALKKSEDHVYLVGEGGIGKTTSLIHIMEWAYKGKQYSETAQIPLFVELSKAPDTPGRLYANGISTFIRRAVYRQVREDRTVKQVTEAEIGALDEVFSADPLTVVRPIDSLLTEEHRPPEYLLLLDGLNEVSRTVLEILPTDEKGRTIPGEPIRISVVRMIIEEINHVMERFPNVRVILTGRADEDVVDSEGMIRYQLSGIDDRAILGYLDKKKIPAEDIGRITGDKVLMETLRIPLFLTMAAELQNLSGITTQGEILHAFFSEKAKRLRGYDIPYTIRNRAGQVEAELTHTASGRQNARLTVDMQSFMVDFLLSALGRYMESRDVFSVDPWTVETVITPILEGTKDTDICGRFGQNAFPRYKKRGMESNTAVTAKALISILGTGHKAAEMFCILCSSVLGILVDDGQHHYSFIHQHVRDYFAALYVINALWISVVSNMADRDQSYAFLNREIGEFPLRTTVRRMIGEALGEHHNKPDCDEVGIRHYAVPEKVCERKLIHLALDVFRSRFAGSGGYGLWNLIRILKEVRKDLSGEDLSRLDLTGIRLNGICLGQKGCSADLHGSKMERELFMPGGHSDSVNSVSWSPDGKRIVTASSDKTARVWDAETFRELGTLEGHSDRVISAAWSRDGRMIVTASNDNTARIWDAGSFRELGKLEGHTQSVNSAAFSPDGRYILTASGDTTVQIWDTETFSEISVLEGHSDWVTSAAWSPDGGRIVTASDDNTVRIWDAKTFHEIGMLGWYSNRITSVVWNRDSRRILTSSWDGTVSVWDTETFREIGIIESHSQGVLSAVWSPDGRRIVTTSLENIARVWDAETFHELGMLEGHSGWILSSAWSPDSRRIVTASRDETARIWDAKTFSELGILEGHSLCVKSTAWSPDSSRIVTLSWDETAGIWDMKTFRELGTLKGHSGWVYSAAWKPDSRRIMSELLDSHKKVRENIIIRLGTQKEYTGCINTISWDPDGKQIVTASWDNTVIVWDAENFCKLGQLKGHSDWVTSVSWSPDGRKIVTTSWDKTAKVWDAETFCELGTLKGHYGWVNSADWSPDSTRIVTVSRDKTARIWDAKTFCEIGKLKGHSGWVNSADWSPDGTRIVTASDDGTAMIWDADTFRRRGKPLEHSNWVNLAAWSPDNRRIMTVSIDSIVRIWNAETIYEFRTLEDFSKLVISAAWSPDGYSFLTSYGDGTVRIWSSETYQCLRVIRCVPGLEVIGCDFRDLHPDSRLSDEGRQLLWEHGAEV